MIAAIPSYVWAVGTSGILAFGVGVLLYLKKNGPAKLVYQWNGRIVVGKEKEELPEEIAIAMREAGSPYISSSEIVFWNAGQQTIHGSDIDGVDPLRITMASGARILRIL